MFPPHRRRETDRAAETEACLRRELDEARESARRLRSIVERLAKEGPGLFLGVDAYDCRLCGMRLDGRDHDPSCLWRLAVEAIR